MDFPLLILATKNPLLVLWISNGLSVADWWIIYNIKQVNPDKIFHFTWQIYFLLNPNTNKLQEYYKQGKKKKKNMAISVGSYLKLFKEFIPAHWIYFFLRVPCSFKMDLKISPIARPHDTLLNLKKYNNKLLLNK